MRVSSWAEHLRQHTRTTKAETELAERVWKMHAGDREPEGSHSLPAGRITTPLGFGAFRKRFEAPLAKPAAQSLDGQSSDSVEQDFRN